MSNLRSDIRLIPNPVELENFTYRERTNIAPNLVWVRVFHQIYNPMMAVEVVKLLRADFPNIKLTMIGPDEGDGSYDATLTYIRDMGLSEFLLVIPGLPYSAVPQQLEQNDIFLNTSLYDSAPRCLIEAMACGLCVVSTNVGGIPWMVRNQMEGLLVAPDEPYAMADAIRNILTKPDLAHELSINGRNKAKLFNWPAILSQWEALFREIIDDPRIYR